MLNPIRIGDTFNTRTYSYKEANGDPKPLTGYTVSFHIQNGNQLHNFTVGDGITVAVLTGVISIALTAEHTAQFEPDVISESYIKLIYPTGEQRTVAQRAERIITPHTSV